MPSDAAPAPRRRAGRARAGYWPGIDGDLVADAGAVGDEERVDEVARVQPRLGDEAAQGLAAAQAPEALEGGRETNRGRHISSSLTDGGIVPA